MSDPGWYNAEGDPPGTHRYWDGTKWVGDPVAAPSGGVGVGGVAGTNRGARGLASDPGKRMLGRFIDIIIFVILMGIFVLLDIGGEPNLIADDQAFQFRINDHALDTRAEYLISTIFFFVWTTGWTHVAGGTPGKLALGMRVADDATNQIPITLQQSAMRALNSLLGLLGLVSLGLGALGSGLSLLIGIASLIMLFADDEHRTVMDRVAKTLVVDKN